MEISVREAARLLGRSVRTVRDQAARGTLPATKKGRGWVLRDEHLPLTAAQRAALQARADEVRDALDTHLPSRDAATPADRRRTLADLDAFRLTAALHADITAPELSEVRAELHAALLAVGEASQVWEREPKLAAVERARAALGRAEVRLRLTGHDPTSPWLDRLLHQVQPAVSGWARWVANLRRRP